MNVTKKEYVMVEKDFLRKIQNYLQRHPHMKGDEEYIDYLDMLDQIQSDLSGGRL